MNLTKIIQVNQTPYVITGVGMGMLWVVAPKILTDNSTEKNLQRNNSIWWCIYIFSMVIGMFHGLNSFNNLIILIMI